MRTSAFLTLLLATSTLAIAGGPTSPAAPPQQRSDKKAPANPVHGASYQPLAIKTGLWEVTYSRSANGDVPMPAGFASRLTPEQRARYEAAMKEKSSHTYKSCVKKDDINGSLLKNDQKCDVTILKSTSTELDGKMACNMEEGMRGSGTMNMHVVDSEHTQGVTHMTMTGGGRTFNTDATLSSKWIGSDCKGKE